VRKMRLLSNIRFAVQRLRGGSGRPCAHIDRIRDVAPTSEGCERCTAAGDTWVHLRTCVTCGQVDCCDSSKNKHGHADEAGYPIARSEVPGEDWLWCYVDEALVKPEVP
jgi:hypothetical protein